MKITRRGFAKSILMLCAGSPAFAMKSSSLIIAASVVGQSNEQGAGRIADKKMNGESLVDPIQPNGGARSWWPYLAKRLREEKNISLKLRNTAVGVTSLCDSWVGRIRIWRSGMPCVKGSYCVSNGGLFKLEGSTGTVFVSRNVPDGSNFGQVLADGCKWRYLGVSSEAQSVVDAEINPTIFDPNGYLQRAYVEVKSIESSEKWVFLSIGQTDKTLGVSGEDFARAIEQVAKFFTSRGIKVLVGFTCYGDTQGLDQWFAAQLIPGVQLALANLESNPLVFKGANLREALGVLPILESDERPGLVDQLHLNNAGYVAAANAWYNAIIDSQIYTRAKVKKNVI